MVHLTPCVNSPVHQLVALLCIPGADWSKTAKLTREDVCFSLNHADTATVCLPYFHVLHKLFSVWVICHVTGMQIFEHIKM